MTCPRCAYGHSTGLPLILDGVLRWTKAVREMHTRSGCKGKLMIECVAEPEEVADAS